MSVENVSFFYEMMKNLVRETIDYVSFLILIFYVCDHNAILVLFFYRKVVLSTFFFSTPSHVQFAEPR